LQNSRIPDVTGHTQAKAASELRKLSDLVHTSSSYTGSSQTLSTPLPPTLEALRPCPHLFLLHWKVSLAAREQESCPFECKKTATSRTESVGLSDYRTPLQLPE
jgi:hypothetical protein